MQDIHGGASSAAAYGHISRLFPVKKGQKIAAGVVSQFGEQTRSAPRESPQAGAQVFAIINAGVRFSCKFPKRERAMPSVLATCFSLLRPPFQLNVFGVRTFAKRASPREKACLL